MCLISVINVPYLLRCFDQLQSFLDGVKDIDISIFRISGKSRSPSLPKRNSRPSSMLASNPARLQPPLQTLLQPLL